MSAEQQMFFPPSSPLSSPQAEMETLRMFVSERLTAAVDDILGVFVKTVTRYRDHIDRQQRQLDSLKSEEGRWIQTAGQCEEHNHSTERLIMISMSAEEDH